MVSSQSMTAVLPGGPAMASPQPLPNNLGPTLLLVIGIPLLPLLIGVPLLLLGLARLRDADGAPAVPWLGRLPRSEQR